MTDGVTVDFSELMEFAADLAGVPAEASKNVRKAIQVTSGRVKADWRKTADRTGLHGYAARVTYDTKESSSGIEAEIGPKLGGQGSMGFVEDGGGGVKSAPQHAGRDAAKANEADFVKGLTLAIAKPLEEL